MKRAAGRRDPSGAGQRAFGMGGWLRAALGLSVLASIVGGFGCTFWLELPDPGWTPTYLAWGNWDSGAPWFVEHKGTVNYTAYWLGFNDQFTGQLRQGDMWEIKSVQMTNQAALDQLEPLTNNGFEFVMEASLDIWNYDGDEDEWVLDPEWENLGADKECQEPKLFPGGWLILCGDRNIGKARRQPMGVYELYFSVDSSMGSCLGGCDAFFTHRVPFSLDES